MLHLAPEEESRVFLIVNLHPIASHVLHACVRISGDHIGCRKVRSSIASRRPNRGGDRQQASFDTGFHYRLYRPAFHANRLPWPTQRRSPTFKQRFGGNSERSRIGGIRRVKVHRDRDVVVLDILEDQAIGIIFGCGFHGPASDAGDFPILVHGFDDSLETSGLFEEAEKRAQIEERRRGWRGHTNTSPPSTTIVCPVIKSLSDEARKTMVPSKSSGVSVRPRARSAIT